MFLEVEWMRIEPATDEALARNHQSHSFAKDIGDDGQEDGGHEDDLRLEVENLLEYGTKDGKPNPCTGRERHV